MSLASLLLGGTAKTTKAAPVDNDLDALFRANPAPPVPKAMPSSAPSSEKKGEARGRKRKRQQEMSRAAVELRVSPVPARAPKKTKSTRSNVVVERVSSGEDEAKDEDLEEGEDVGEDEDEDDARLEDSYLTQHKAAAKPSSADDHDDIQVPSGSSSNEDEDDDDAPPPAHETHVKKARFKSRKKTKYVPPDETPAQRDARTIFIGNVSIAVAKSKSSQKQLKQHFLTLIPTSRIDSIRFRSVAFASATSALPSEPSPQKSARDAKAPPSTKQQRQKDRAAQWRSSTSTTTPASKKSTQHEDETSDREDTTHNKKGPAFLSPAERKRVAFIKGEFHGEVDTVNAYVVFGYAGGVEGASAEAVHPDEAARLAVERGDGTIFMERTIRVDRVGQWRAGARGTGTGSSVDVGVAGDPRATLFVGNLDFAAKEEDLRVWFEGAVAGERGPPGGGESGDDAGDAADDTMEGKGTEEVTRNAWVRSVRIVRDKDTQLGKGFAYVRFLDRECVDEVLALEPSALKFAKRTLRVQRCKVVPTSSTAPKAKTKTKAPRASASNTNPHTPAPPLPKGDPTLGSRLAGLSKEERKAAKAANVDRVKRRLAKKKVGAGVERVRGKTGGQVKERERERKREKGGKGKKAVNKGRVRSERSVGRRNAKK